MASINITFTRNNQLIRVPENFCSVKTVLELSADIYDMEYLFSFIFRFKVSMPVLFALLELFVTYWYYCALNYLILSSALSDAKTLYTKAGTALQLHQKEGMMERSSAGDFFPFNNRYRIWREARCYTNSSPNMQQKTTGRSSLTGSLLLSQ